MKKVKSLIAVLIALVVMCASAIPALATDEEVRATADGVFFLSFKINDRRFGRGSCFLINEDTIITSNHCVHLSEYEYEFYDEYYGLKKKDINKQLTYEITISRDFTIPATLVNSSENMDFAILKLSQPINNHKSLPLRDSSTINVAETVYSVGFPAIKDSMAETAQYYNKKDMIFESGTINRTQYTDEFYFGKEYFKFVGDVLMATASTMNGGNSGGPLVDVNGNVVGICMAGNSGSCYASAISQVMEVLDTINVKYDKAGEVTETTTTTTTTKPAEPAADDKKEDTKKEDGGLSKGAIIGIIAAVAAVALVAVIIIVVSKKNSAPASPAAPNAAGGFTPPTPPSTPSNTATGAGAEGSEGTTVLSSNASDPNATTVLGASAASAYLLRLSNNEKIYITKPYFKIGKDANRVDYCITGNPAVSRFHASVVSKNGQYFIVDNSTTNHTYVNDSMIPANVETQISNGAKIRLADEKFEFKI